LLYTLPLFKPCRPRTVKDEISRNARQGNREMVTTKFFMTMKREIILAIALLMAAFMAKAQEVTRTDARQATQHVRIAEGRVDGEITHRERTALKREQRRVRRTERRVESDGVVTRREGAVLERKQDRASRHIRRAKHNQRERPN
jgi:hypothetical protein